MELKKNAKSINNLLNSPKTRIAGLHLLNSYLFNCTDDDILEYCSGWMQNCCKIDGSIKDRDFAIETLGKIIQLSANYPELNKAVSFFISNRLSDYFFKHLTNSNLGWNCMKICFLHYRGSCGPSQETFEKHLFNAIGRNVKISNEVSQCSALLPSLGGCGKEKNTYQINWKNQFLKFINITHLILNDLYVNVEELNEYGSPDSSYKQSTDSDYLLVQLQNYCSVIIDMLLIKYPAPKHISTDLVLELICRGLAINPIVLKKNETSSIISLKKKLPNIYITLLNVLNALITTCKTQLLPYSQLICKLIKQTLNWSQSDFKYENEKCFAVLRISIYQVLCNWLIETKTGGCIDTISQFIIPQIFSDIKSKKSVLLLKVRKSNLKNDSKNNEHSVGRLNPSANSELIYAALKVLQYFLKFYGILLTADDHKFLQETIIKMLMDIQINFSSEVLFPYSLSLCREALYSVLFKLVQHPCPAWPPPTHFAFRIFKRGQYDRCPEISAFCSFALSITTNIIHQQYSNGPVISTENAQNQYQSTGLFCGTREKSGSSNGLLLEPEEKESSDSSEDVDEILPKENNNSREDVNFEILHTENTDSSDVIVDISPEQSESGNDEVSKPLENENDIEELKQGSNVPFSPKENLELVKKSDKLDTSLKNSAQDIYAMQNSENVLIDSDGSDDNEENNVVDLEVKENSKGEENNQSTSFAENIEKDEELLGKKSTPPKKESDSVTPEKVSIDDCSASQKTPEKVNKSEGNSSEDSGSCHSVISERRYFLRSKTIDGLTEEVKEISKRTSSPDLVRSTPGRGLGKGTPLSVKSANRRPRTRALSKLEVDEKDGDFSTPKKSKISKNNHDEDNDDDCDIIEVFDDTIVG